jgi:hypothetical protein
LLIFLKFTKGDRSLIRSQNRLLELVDSILGPARELLGA